MNIHVANTAGDATEFAEISTEKSPLCEKHTSTLVVYSMHACMVGLSLSFYVSVLL